MKQLIALSGLPRTGSTLLTSILIQNPNIHAGPNSPLCQLAWDLAVSAERNASEQMAASGRTVKQLLRQFAASFYADTPQPIVVDKCRSWTLEPNMKLLEAMTDNPKVIVMMRPLEQIVASLVAARHNAGWEGDIETQLLRDGSEPIMRSLAGVEWARINNDGQFLFVEYDDLVDRPEETLARIYAFCGWQPFAHNFTHITNANPEPDNVYGIEGFHEIRPTLSRRAVNANLSPATLAECARLDARR